MKWIRFLGAGQMYILFLIIPMTMFAQLRIEVAFQNASREYLPGTPIHVNVLFTNSGNIPIKLICKPSIFDSSFYIERLSGPNIPTNQLNIKGSKEYNGYILKSQESVLCKSFPYKLNIPGTYTFKYVYDPMREMSNWPPNLIENYFTERIESEVFSITILKLNQLDNEVFNTYVKNATMFAWMGGKQGEKLLQDYPSSKYAGWVLLKYRPDIPGVFHSDESNKKMIMAAIRGDSTEINTCWRIDRPLPDNDTMQNRRTLMGKLIKDIEIFINTNPDFEFAGWLAARAGKNALGLREYEKACHMIHMSTRLKWELPEINNARETTLRNAALEAFTFLQNEEICTPISE